MNCKTCGQPLPEGSSLWVEAEILSSGDWFDWYRRHEGYATYTGRFEIEKVAEKGHQTDEGGDGIESEVWMVFRVEDKHYRKNGFSDSYGGIEWDGSFTEVSPKTKTVTFFE